MSNNDPRPAEPRFGAALQQNLKQDMLWLAGGIIIMSIVLKLLFPLSSITTIAKLAGGIVWLFVLPGYCIMLAMSALPKMFANRVGDMLPLCHELELKERVIVGMLAAAGLLAIASYYAGILGMHIRSHALLFPAAIIIVSILLVYSARFMNSAQSGSRR